MAAVLISIENARVTLSKQWFALAGLNAGCIGMFLAPFSTHLTAQEFIYVLIAAAFIGMLIGLHFMFRSMLGTNAALFLLAYLLFILEIMMSLAAVAMAMRVAGRFDLYWFACVTHLFVMVLTLLLGISREALGLGLSSKRRDSCWRKKLAAHIDYSKWQVHPSLMGPSVNMSRTRLRSLQLVVAVGVVNVPLAFEFFGGERDNLIFSVVAIFVLTCAYLNVKNFGPSLLRLILLRKLEKEAGRRFVNADYEQIQELRRTFFLSRWLMMDYVRRPDSSSLSSLKTHPKKCR